MLRRHGLYSSHLTKWRQEREVRNPGRSGSAKARAEVEGQSADRGESETAARQRAADRSAAQGGDRDRRSKKSGYAAGPSDRGDGGSRESGHRRSYADGRSESRLRGASIFLVLLFIGRGFWGFFLRRPPPCGLCRGRWIPRNGKQCWPAFMRRDFKTARRRRFTPRCSTKAGIIARFAPCTGFWKARARRVSAATSSCIRLTRSRNCWPPAPTSSGAGTSRNCSVRRSGRTSIST